MWIGFFGSGEDPVANEAACCIQGREFLIFCVAEQVLASQGQLITALW